MMMYSYYPGCTLKTKAADLDGCARASAAKLGVTLEELPQWQCCGAVYPQAGDEIASRLSAVRALAAARDLGRDLVTVCSACHHVLKRTNEDLKRDENFRRKANDYLQLDAPYAGETRVIHFLELLRDDLGFDKVRSAVTSPLKGRKIAPYYGCLLLRPSQQMSLDDPENPRVMEDLLRALGAQAVFFPYRNECCGGYIQLEEPGEARRLSERTARSAGEMGAQALVTACPLCKYNLEKNAGEAALPVYYFTELLAEALGAKEA